MVKKKRDINQHDLKIGYLDFVKPVNRGSETQL